MPTLALDVDGVLLDPDRGGAGHWTNELGRLGITRAQLRAAFFLRSWDDVITGRHSIETALAEALAELAVDIEVDDLLGVWFEADYVPIPAALALARRAGTAGCRVVLATNQEHRRATFLRARLGSLIPIADVLYSADLGVVKHEPEFFDLASARLGVDDADRSDVVFVDDVEPNVEQARLAGWTAVHAATGYDWIPDAERALGL